MAGFPSKRHGDRDRQPGRFARQREPGPRAGPDAPSELSQLIADLCAGTLIGRRLISRSFSMGVSPRRPRPRPAEPFGPNPLRQAQGRALIQDRCIGGHLGSRVAGFGMPNGLRKVQHWPGGGRLLVEQGLVTRPTSSSIRRRRRSTIWTCGARSPWQIPQPRVENRRSGSAVSVDGSRAAPGVWRATAGTERRYANSAADSSASRLRNTGMGGRAGIPV